MKQVNLQDLVLITVAVRSTGRDEPAALCASGRTPASARWLVCSRVSLHPAEWPEGDCDRLTAPSTEQQSTCETFLADIYGSGHKPGEEILYLLRNTQDAEARLLPENHL